ncbi:RUS family member 1-like isoform X2 [Artemia franciscana]|uniref:RUS family member 1-like isoform X2 n=1 Tax=Artemia franciscana TaxID=6661 RepID=UPI0032DB64B9
MGGSIMSGVIIEYKGERRCLELSSDGAKYSRNCAPRPNLFQFFVDIFLPEGFPESVSKDYVQYQIWDSFQALFSSLNGALATKAVLTGVGVGNAEATVLGATLTWLIRDGASMIGRISFSALIGSQLDANCKQWRLFADILNDVAMGFEIVSPMLMPNYMFLIFCIAGICKAIVGVAGGATRTALTYHQAQKGNFADVAAKDGSQETLVNLFALVVNLLLLPIMVSSTTMTLTFFILLSVFHVYANYKAVSSLCIPRLNRHRLNYIIEQFSRNGQVPCVDLANRNELLFNLSCGRERHMFGKDIIVAPSVSKYGYLKELEGIQSELFALIENKNKKQTAIFLSNKSNAKHTIQAYYLATTKNIGVHPEDFVSKLESVGWEIDDQLLLVGEYRLQVDKISSS